MPPKIQKPIKNIENISEEPILAVLEEKVESESDDEIQAPPPPKPKPKRVLTEKQKEILAKGRAIGREKLNEKYSLMKNEKNSLKEQKKSIVEEKKVKQIEIVNKAKKEMEDKLIRTAVAVKKKQLVEEKRLAKFTEDIEEEIPDEVVKKIIREKKIAIPVPVPVEPPNPFAKYYFL